jgi:hypothetical protein
LSEDLRDPVVNAVRMEGTDHRVSLEALRELVDGGSGGGPVLPGALVGRVDLVGGLGGSAGAEGTADRRQRGGEVGEVVVVRGLVDVALGVVEVL